MYAQLYCLTHSLIWLLEFRLANYAKLKMSALYVEESTLKRENLMAQINGHTWET